MSLKPGIDNDVHVSQSFQLILVDDQGVLPSIRAPIDPPDVISRHIRAAAEKVETLSPQISLHGAGKRSRSAWMNADGAEPLGSRMSDDSGFMGNRFHATGQSPS